MPKNNDNPLSHLGFQRFGPSLKLSAIVECYWFINSDYPVDSTEYLHPDGGMGIILNYADVFQFDDRLNNEACILDGTNTFSRKFSVKGMLNAIGIRFKPAGASLLFSIPLNELKNATIPLADTLLKKQNRLYYRLSKVQTFHAKISLIEDWLCRSIQAEKNISNVVSASLMLLNRHKGLLPINYVANQLDFNQRRIERLFNLQVGMTAKEYSRNLRIEQARFYLKPESVTSMRITECKTLV